MRPTPSPARARRPHARLRARVAVRRIALAAAALAAAAATPASTARGQEGDPVESRSVRAFERSVTPWIGISGYGARATNAGTDFGYGSAFTVGVTGDLPLTRRTAAMGTVSIAPSVKQTVTAHGTSSPAYVAGTATLAAFELGLAGRLRAQVPVFLYAGAGIVHATLDAYPVDAQASNFPRGTLALGYDGGRTRPGRLGLRAVAAAHLSKPADPNVTGLTVRSHAVDYTVELGLPIRFTARDRR